MESLNISISISELGRKYGVVPNKYRNWRVHAFKNSICVSGPRVQYVLRNAPEKNGYIDSPHKALKKEYFWVKALCSHQEAAVAIANAFGGYIHRRILSGNQLAVGIPCPVRVTGCIESLQRHSAGRRRAADGGRNEVRPRQVSKVAGSLQ